MKKPSYPLALDDIKGARVLLEISQRQMAAHLGVSQPTILRWEDHGLPEGWQFRSVHERVAEFIAKLNADAAEKEKKAKKKTKAKEFA